MPVSIFVRLDGFESLPFIDNSSSSQKNAPQFLLKSSFDSDLRAKSAHDNIYPVIDPVDNNDIDINAMLINPDLGEFQKRLLEELLENEI